MISKGKARLDLIHYGEETIAENFKYEGEIDSKGLPCGFGSAVSKENRDRKVSGTFFEGLPHGVVVQQDADCIAVTEYKEGKKHGFGTEYHEDKIVNCRWKNGKLRKS